MYRQKCNIFFKKNNFKININIFTKMNNKQNLKLLITEKEILSCYSQYFLLIKKYKDKFKDNNIPNRFKYKYKIINIRLLIF